MLSYRSLLSNDYQKKLTADFTRDLITFINEIEILNYDFRSMSFDTIKKTAKELKEKLEELKRKLSFLKDDEMVSVYQKSFLIISNCLNQLIESPKLNDNIIPMLYFQNQFVAPILAELRDPFDLLPREVLVNILLHLSPEELHQMSRVTKILKEASSDNFVWQIKFQSHFPEQYSDLSKQNGVDWFSQFKLAYEGLYGHLNPVCREIFSLIAENDFSQLVDKIKKEHLDQKDSNGISVLSLLLKNSPQFVLDRIFKIVEVHYFDDDGVNFYRVDSHGLTALHWMVICNQSEFLQKCLSLAMFDLEKKTEYPQLDFLSQTGTGNTLLHLASIFNRTSIAQILLNSHADIEAKNNWFYTPLLLAVYYGHLDMVKLLFSSGCLLQERARGRETVLILAAFHGHLEIIKELVEYGADLHAQNEKSGNALLVAIVANHADTVDYLLEKGCASTIQLSNGKQLNGIVIAAHLGFKHIVDILLKHQPDLIDFLNMALHEAIKTRSLSRVRSLLACGADINYRLTDGMSVLHLAVLYRDVERVRYILDLGANIDAVDDEGNTPLIIAAQMGELATKVISLLVERKANIEAKNTKGESAIDILLENRDYDLAAELTRAKNGQANSLSLAKSSEDNEVIDSSNFDTTTEEEDVSSYAEWREASRLIHSIADVEPDAFSDVLSYVSDSDVESNHSFGI